MLLPRFSIRWVLLLTALLGFSFLIIRQAILGSHWAMAFSATLTFSVTVLLLYAVTFLGAYALARATRSLNPPEKPRNPFVVEGQYPPQMVPKGPFGSQGDE